ncbi:LemA family protein [Candidatus Gottesmanbacteria bacterium]|nr:LemA family protein [Candidatus Gottesmanbacteria bacterium]
MNKVTLIILGPVLLIGGWLVSSYNGFATQGNAIDGQWKQVEVQYQRRFDLVPNLVESVKGLQKQEQKVFGDIAEARTRYSGASTVNEKAGAATQLESALGRLLVIMENYPQLKSDVATARLMDELSGTENRVSVERRRYNELVQSYNTSLSVIPGNLLAGIFGFSRRSYFEATEGSEATPKVQF